MACIQHQGCGRADGARRPGPPSAAAAAAQGLGPPPAAAPCIGLQLFGSLFGPTPGSMEPRAAPCSGRGELRGAISRGWAMSEAACLVACPKRACALGSAQNLEPCPKCIEPAELPAAACVAPATGLDSHAAHAEERRPAARRPPPCRHPSTTNRPINSLDSQNSSGPGPRGASDCGLHPCLGAAAGRAQGRERQVCGAPRARLRPAPLSERLTESESRQEAGSGAPESCCGALATVRLVGAQRGEALGGCQQYAMLARPTCAADLLSCLCCQICLDCCRFRHWRGGGLAGWAQCCRRLCGGPCPRCRRFLAAAALHRSLCGATVYACGAARALCLPPSGARALPALRCAGPRSGGGVAARAGAP